MNTNPKPIVYVAGPITGDPFGCVRSALPAFHMLRRIGAVPFLPQLSILHEIVESVPYEEWLAYDFDVLVRSDALYRLPGDSPGADREAEFMESMDKPVFHDGSTTETELYQWVTKWIASTRAKAVAS